VAKKAKQLPLIRTSQPEAAIVSDRQLPNRDEILQLRREGGRWLRELREATGLSQRQLADRLGIEPYTVISQLETGRGRIQPERYRDWATALGAQPQAFVRNLLRYYDPFAYDMLFLKPN
jgi:ribosome-binding protein aMBF1 (putative translation factor)